MNFETEANLESLREIVKQEPAVLVYFFNDHCAPCTSLRPKVESLLFREFPNIRFLLINGEKQLEVSASYGVYSHPTLIIFFEGKEYIRESKYVSIGQLDRAIRRPYDLLFGN